MGPPCAKGSMNRPFTCEQDVHLWTGPWSMCEWVHGWMGPPHVNETYTCVNVFFSYVNGNSIHPWTRTSTCEWDLDQSGIGAPCVNSTPHVNRISRCEQVFQVRTGPPQCTCEWDQLMWTGPLPAKGSSTCEVNGTSTCEQLFHEWTGPPHVNKISTCDRSSTWKWDFHIRMRSAPSSTLNWTSVSKKDLLV